MISESKKNLAPATNLGAFKGGSLPNVSEQNRKQQTTIDQVVDDANVTGKKVQNKNKQTHTHTKLFQCVYIFSERKMCVFFLFAFSRDYDACACALCRK